MAGALIVLAAGSSPTTSGQSEEPLDPMGASFWTGTLTPTGGGPAEEIPGPGFTDYIGAMGRGDLAADDARIDGTLTQVANGRLLGNREAGAGDVGVVNGTARIDNDAGAWVGTYTTYGGAPAREEWYVLEGEGAYEGLTAVFSFHGDDSIFEGVIVPGDLPPLPDPIAPPAE
jgi:hypothetical protein